MRKFVFKFMELKTDYIARFFRKIQWHKSRKIRISWRMLLQQQQQHCKQHHDIETVWNSETNCDFFIFFIAQCARDNNFLCWAIELWACLFLRAMRQQTTGEEGEIAHSKMWKCVIREIHSHCVKNLVRKKGSFLLS